VSQLYLQAIGGFIAIGITFAVMYPSMLNKLSRSLISPYPRADVRRRAYAALVDALIVASGCLLAFGFKSMLLAGMCAVYVLLRDAIHGTSVGKFLFGLMVVNLETSRPASIVDSTARNLMFVLPGLNVAAVALETRTIVRDELGQRLGDRMAMTQVVDGFGAKQLVKEFEDLVSHIAAHGGWPKERPREVPERRDKAA
jgi:uncharacterized RDD family membrane protein YckC